MVPYANGAGCLLLKQKTQLPRSILRKYSLGEEKHQIKKKKKKCGHTKIWFHFISFLFFLFLHSKTEAREKQSSSKNKCYLCQRDCEQWMVSFSRLRSKIELKHIARALKTNFTVYTEEY